MNIAWVWHKADEEKPTKSGMYIVRTSSGLYRCIPYCAEYDKWNVTETLDLSHEVKGVALWAEILTPEKILEINAKWVYRQRYKSKQKAKRSK